MTKEIRAYLAALEQFFAAEHSEEELLEFRGKLLKRIEFYQHERLIHLIVTMSFAVFFLLSLAMSFSNPQIGLTLLTVLFLAMTVAYIKHYYFLENSVQRMYKYYYRIENL
ncbi:MAG: hypothetical protein NC299_10290 [Lachnospiraceae bacterium]|nr:hypothetical protein [Ruminococcus sp.]MCM1275736.1 hypothetical protein [Lachnospiraceae bacterium]